MKLIIQDIRMTKEDTDQLPRLLQSWWNENNRAFIFYALGASISTEITNKFEFSEDQKFDSSLDAVNAEYLFELIIFKQ